MNDYDYVRLWYDVRHVQFYEIEQDMKVLPKTILGFPNRPV
jgi:hypothetical protein